MDKTEINKVTKTGQINREEKTQTDSMSCSNLANTALEMAKKAGCNAARVTISANTQSVYNVRDNKMERIHRATSSSIYLQLFSDGKYGTFSTNRMGTGELESFIKKAAGITRLLAPDIHRNLPDPSLYYKGNNEDLEQFDPSINTLDPLDKSKIAYDCAAEIYKSDPRILSVNSEFGDIDDYVYIADSNGFSGESRQSSFSLSCECSVKDNGDARPEGWWYESSLFLDSLVKEGVGKKALERALSRLSPVKMKSGKYNMVLENTVSSRVVAPIISALNGASIQQNNSFLKDKAGKKVFHDKFQLVDIPHTKRAAGSRYFDSEGIATKPMNIIENGTVNTYFINTYHSNKLSLPVTIEGPSVPICRFTESATGESPAQNLSGILKLCGNGILVTGFNGGNSNSSTGDFSFGVQGFWFENGIIKHPVGEMNITGNIITLWNSLIAAGTDARETGRWLIPTLAFENVNLSGI